MKLLTYFPPTSVLAFRDSPSSDCQVQDVPLLRDYRLAQPCREALSRASKGSLPCLTQWRQLSLISGVKVTLAFVPSGLSCPSVQMRNNRGPTGELGSRGMLALLTTEQEELERSSYNPSPSLRAQHLSRALGRLTSDQLTFLPRTVHREPSRALSRGPLPSQQPRGALSSRQN